jgi:hypothetical protein
MRANLNLASNPLGNSRRFFAVAVAAGLPGLILFVMLCMKVARDRAADSVLRTEMSRIEKEMAGYRTQRRELEEFFADPATRLVTQRAAFLNGIIDQRSFPWTQFFVDFEHYLPQGVRVLSITPNLEGDRVQIKMKVGALSDKSKLEFLKALEGAPEFSLIEVVSETRPAKSADDRDVVEMDLTADYRAIGWAVPAAVPAAKKTGPKRGGE